MKPNPTKYPSGPAGGRPVPPPTGPGSNLDNRLATLKDKLAGAGNKQQDALKKKISNVHARQYLQGEKNQPAEQLPYDAQYETTVAGAGRDLNASLGTSQYERERLDSAYGFDNPAANPYSRAALLQKNYNEQNAGTVNSYAARGQLYAGSTQNQLNANTFGYGQAYDAARGEYEDAIRSNQDDVTGAGDSYLTALGTAGADRLQRALSTPVDPATTPATPDFVKKFLHQQKQAQKGKNNGKK